jgi:hypothetical protein
MLKHLLQILKQTLKHLLSHREANHEAKSNPLPSPPMEEKEEDLPLPSTTDAPPLPAWVAALPFPPLPAPWWHDTLRLFPKPDHEATARSAAAYWLDHRATIPEVRGFLRRQFARAFERYQAALPPDPYATFPVLFDCTCVEGCHVTPPGTTTRPPCPHGALPTPGGSPA